MAEACREPGTDEPAPERQKIVEHLFRALTDINAEGNAVRRPQTLAELMVVTGSDEPMLKEIIDRFRADGASFLTPYGDAEIRPDTPIDISHEALIRCWRKIADEKEGWLQREFQDGLIWQSLRIQAGRFADNEEEVLSPAATEYSDRWLGTLPSNSWTERYDGGWSGVQELMAASREEAKRQRDLESARRREAEARALEENARAERADKLRRKAEEEKERADQQARRARRLGYASIALAVVMVLAAIVGVIAWQMQLEAQQQRQLAEAQRLAAEEQRQLAMTQRHAAEEARLLAETQRRLAEELRELAASERRRTDELFQSELTHAGLLAKGEQYARAREVLENSQQLDGQIALERRHARDFLARYVDVMGGGAQKVYEGAGAPLLSVAVSPDGDLLAATGEKGTVVLFDVESGEVRQRLGGHRGNVWDVAFHPEGAWLVTGGQDGQIIRWSMPAADTPAGQLQTWIAPEAVSCVAVSPDGRLLATGGIDNNISLWNAETGELVRRLEGHQSAIMQSTGLTFSPSGHRLASASLDRTARVWNVETGESLQIFRGHSDYVGGVVFANVDSQIATTSGPSDRRTVFWDVESGRPVQVFAGHANGVYGIGYLAGGAQPDAATAAGQNTPPLLVTGSFDRTLRVWDTDTGVTVRVLEGHLNGVTEVVVHTPKESDAAAQVFSASTDGTVRRWDSTPLPHQRLIHVPGEPWAAAIAPDGSRIAVGFQDGSLRLYAIPAGRLIAEVENAYDAGNAHDAGVDRLALGTEGSALASASDDLSAKLWSVGADGELTLQQTFTGHGASVYGIALSHDGKTLATASFDGRVGLFRVGAKDEGRFIDAHKGRVQSVAFDAAGTTLLSAGYDNKTARLWLTTDPPALIREFPEAQAELMWAALSPVTGWLPPRDAVEPSTSTGQMRASCFAASWATSRRSIAPTSALTDGS
jgi:WD40 repeat protein